MLNWYIAKEVKEDKKKTWWETPRYDKSYKGLPDDKALDRND